MQTNNAPAWHSIHSSEPLESLHAPYDKLLHYHGDLQEKTVIENTHQYPDIFC